MSQRLILIYTAKGVLMRKNTLRTTGDSEEFMFQNFEKNLVFCYVIICPVLTRIDRGREVQLIYERPLTLSKRQQN